MVGASLEDSDADWQYYGSVGVTSPSDSLLCELAQLCLQQPCLENVRTRASRERGSKGQREGGRAIARE